MNWRLVATAGVGVSAFLVAGAAVTGLLAATIEFSALIGLPVGVLAGLIVLATVAVAFDGLDEMERRAMSAYAAFGLTVIGFAALSYVNLARGFFSGTVAAGAGLIAAVLTYLGLWSRER